MKIRYKDVKFRDSSLTTIRQANEIIGDYQQQGLVLTLRQLYYQFVSRDLMANRVESRWKKAVAQENVGRKTLQELSASC